jgi:hypothetical protein
MSATSDPKQLRFSFVVDEASLQRARQFIKELTSDLSKLNETLGKSGFGAGSSSGGVNVGAGGPKSAEAQRVISKVAPAGRPLVQTFLDQKSVFKSLADGSKDHFRVMNDSLKQAIQFQKRELKDLDNAAQHLAETYDELGQKLKTWAGKPGMTAALSAEQTKIGTEHMQTLGDRAKASAELKALEGLLSKEPKGGFWEFLTKKRGGDSALFRSGGPLGPDSFAGTMMGKFGMNPAMLGRIGLGAVGAWGVGAISNELMNNYSRQAQYGAYRGQMFAPEIQASYAGDFRNTMALQEIFRDRDKRGDYLDADTGWRRFGYGVKGFFGGLKGMDIHQMGMAFSGQYGSDQTIKDRQNLVQAERQADPLREIVLGEIVQGAMSRMGAMRALGVGDVTSTNKLRDGQRVSAHFTRLERSLTNMGFGTGDAASALQGVEAGGTRRAFWSGLMGPILQAQAGGMHGAAGFGGIMSRFGPGVGSGFVEAARSMGGMSDVAVANTLAQAVAQQAGGTNVSGISGLGMLGTMGFGVGTGPQSRMIAEQNISGFGALQGLLAGRPDMYQQARNLQVAIGAAPGTGIYAQDYLSNKMSAGQMADIMAGAGDLSPIAKSLGVTRSMVEKQFSGTTRSTLERIINDPNMAGSSMAKTMQSMMGSGMDPRSWFRSKPHGDSTIADYGAFLMMSGQATDESQAMGMARQIFGFGTKASARGRKIGDVAGASLEKEAAETQAKQMDEKVNMLESEAGKLTAQVSIQAEATRKLAELSRQQAITQEQVIEAMQRYAKAMDMIASGQARSPADAFRMADEAISKDRAAAIKAANERAAKEAQKRENSMGNIGHNF